MRDKYFLPSYTAKTTMTYEERIFEEAKMKQDNKELKKRFVVSEKQTGRFVAGIYADRYEDLGSVSINGEGCGHFWRDNEIVASIDSILLSVADTGGRVQIRK